MMNSNIAGLEGARQACNEILETAQLVHGEAFAEVAGHLCEIQQVHYLVACLCGMAGLGDEAREQYLVASSTLLASLGTAITEQLPEHQQGEAMSLGETLGDRITDFLTSDA